MNSFYIYFFLLIFSSCCASQKYFISICTSITDEKNNLDDWIKHHENLGIDHFFIYYSEPSQLSNYAINKSVEGKIHLINWPKMPSVLHKIPVSKISAYEHARECFVKNQTKWLICLDIDEYIVPVKKSLKTILRENKNSHFLEISSIQYTESESSNYLDTISLKKQLFKEAKFSKVFFQPKDTVNFTINPYRPQYKNKVTPNFVKKSCLHIQRRTKIN